MRIRALPGGKTLAQARAAAPGSLATAGARSAMSVNAAVKPGRASRFAMFFGMRSTFFRCLAGSGYNPMDHAIFYYVVAYTFN